MTIENVSVKMPIATTTEYDCQNVDRNDDRHIISIVLSIIFTSNFKQMYSINNMRQMTQKAKLTIHDDVIKWKHFPRNWPFVREIHRSPVNFPHKGQWRGALMFSLIYAWINDWVNNREAGDLRRQHGHYDVIVMRKSNARTDYSDSMASVIFDRKNEDKHYICWLFNTLRPRHNGRHFADNVSKCISLNENVWISIKISLNFVLKCSNNKIPALVLIMAWRRPGDKPLSEPMMVKIPTHVCVTRPQWVDLY